MNKAVFFDRDGVLNVDKGYVWREDQFEFIEGAPEAIRWLNENGFQVHVITNQSGVARGLYTEEDVDAFHRLMSERLTPFGAKIDGYYFCPHHPEGSLEKYRQDCDCRKPQPGLVLRALEEWDIDPSLSVMIGDKERDIQAAQAAGVRGVYYRGGNLLTVVQSAVHSQVRP